MPLRESRPQGSRRMGRCRRGVGTGPYVFLAQVSVALV